MYGLTKDLQNETYPPGIFTVPDMLNDEDIEVLKRIGNPFLVKGGVYGEIDSEPVPHTIQYDNGPTKEQLEKKPRNSNINFIRYDKNKAPLVAIYKKIANKIIEVNEDAFGFKLTDFEAFQYTTYGVGEFYKKHVDISSNLEPGGMMRKLSLSIQLSDESDYEGGELYVYGGGDPVPASKQKGSGSFFPSYMLHEVTPVTSGLRLALVVWAWGPRFV